MYELKQLFKNQIDSSKKPIIYFAEGSLDEEARPLGAAWELSEVANIILVGDEKLIPEHAKKSPTYAEYAAEKGYEVDKLIRETLERVKIINPKDDACKEKRERFAVSTYKKVGVKWRKTEVELKEMMNNHILYSLAATAGLDDCERDGHAVLGGLYSTTGDFFKPGLQLHPRSGTVFEAALFSFQDDNCPSGVYKNNIAVFGDVAVITEMMPERLSDIAIGTCKIARDLLPEKEFPHIYGSIVSYSTAGSGDGVTVEMTRQAYEIIKEKLKNLRSEDTLYEQIHITPEVQYAVAVDEKAAKKKLNVNDPKNIAAGRSNVIILPNLDMGNSMYHLHATYYTDSQKVLISPEARR
jgi:phosphotransacetylase